jgi:hypothetical protein
MSGRLLRSLAVVAAAVAVAAAGVAVNVLLLRYADSRNDPVGKLTPRATLTQPTSPPAKQTTDSEADGDGEERDD